MGPLKGGRKDTLFPILDSNNSLCIWYIRFKFRSVILATFHEFEEALIGIKGMNNELRFP